MDSDFERRLYASKLKKGEFPPSAKELVSKINAKFGKSQIEKYPSLVYLTKYLNQESRSCKIWVAKNIDLDNDEFVRKSEKKFA